MPCPGLQKKINDGVSKNIILSEDFLGSKIYLKLKYKHTVSEAFRDSTVSFSSSIQSYIIIISYIIKKRNAYLCSIIMSMSRHTARWGGAPRRNHKPVWESILMRILLSSLTWDLLSHDTGICLVWYVWHWSLPQYGRLAHSQKECMRVTSPPAVSHWIVLMSHQ